MKTITNQFARLLLLAVCFGITTASIYVNATTFRYLKLTVNAHNNATYGPTFAEIEWLDGTTSYPTTKMSWIPNNGTESVSASANVTNSDLWKAFDGGFSEGWAWSVADNFGSFPYSVTLDLGAGNAIYPTAIKIYMASWDGRGIQSYECAGSNNNSTWTTLLTVTNTPTSSNLNTNLIPAAAPSDAEAPSVPTGLASGTITSASVVLNWTASTDNVGVTGYQVYKNGNLIASPTGTTYTAIGLTANTSYNFQIKAADGVGNTSALCTAISVTTAAAASTPTYRYLKLTVNAHNDENYGPFFTELEWMDGTTSYPTPKMSWKPTNEIATVSASIADAGESQLWKAFDGGYNEGWAYSPVIDGAFTGFPYSITIDLGAGNAIYPTTLKLGMTDWSGRGIKSYSLDGSNDNSTWTNLKLVTNTPTSGNLNTITIPAPVEPIIVSTATNIADIAGLTAASDIIVANGGALTIAASKDLNSITVAVGGKLTITNAPTITGTITLQSSASGTATIKDDYSTPTITATVQQYLPQGRNWYVASPIESALAPVAASSFIGGGIATSVSYYDETQNETLNAWVNNYTGNLLRGVGYVAVSAAGSGTNNISINGKLNSGNVEVNLTRTGTGSFAGYNLIGNPYPSYVNPMAALNALNVEKTIWYRTKGSSYKFETVNTTTGVGTNAAGTGAVKGYIPPLQAFWIRTSADNQILTFTNAMREHANPTGVTTTVLKAKEQNVNSIARIRISGNTGSDEAVVYFNDGASNTYDNYDSRKMFESAEATTPEIFTQVGVEKLAINGLSAVAYETEIPVGFIAKQAGDYNISVSELSNFATGTKLILKDNQYPTIETEITPQMVYNFSAPVTVSSTNRFSLFFRAPGVVTDIDNANKLNGQVYVNAANQIVISAPAKSNYAIYNAIGQLIEIGKLTSNFQTFKRQTGLYIVKVGNESKQLIIK